MYNGSIIVLRMLTREEAEIRYIQHMMRKQYTAAFKARVVQELLKEVTACLKAGKLA